MSSEINLFNMDCMDALRQMDDNQFDLAIVDPPYGIKRLSANENRDPNSKFRRSMAKMVEMSRGWNSNKPTVEYFKELYDLTYGSIDEDDNLICISTGGWSENEVVMRYFEKTWFFQSYCHIRAAGGHYFLDTDYLNPDKKHWEIVRMLKERMRKRRKR